MSIHKLSKGEFVARMLADRELQAQKRRKAGYDVRAYFASRGRKIEHRQTLHYKSQGR